MEHIILTIITLICGIFIGVSCGVRTVTKHLIQNNRLTRIEAEYYYSLSNLIKIFKSTFYEL